MQSIRHGTRYKKHCIPRQALPPFIVPEHNSIYSGKNKEEVPLGASPVRSGIQGGRRTTGGRGWAGCRASRRPARVAAR